MFCQQRPPGPGLMSHLLHLVGGHQTRRPRDQDPVGDHEGAQQLVLLNGGHRSLQSWEVGLQSP